MIRRIIQIDEDKCNGCGACAEACHEGAIGIVGGKAKLLRDDYCDGLGDCQPACPTGAITFVDRETAAYDREAVEEGRTFGLGNWPVQIKLAPVRAPYYKKAHLLIAADCTAYAFAGFHRAFIDGKVRLIGCPKLDGLDYSEKLAAILEENDIADATLVRMEVPCCGGLEMAARKALEAAGKNLPLEVITITIGGKIK